MLFNKEITGDGKGTQNNGDTTAWDDIFVIAIAIKVDFFEKS